MEDLQSINLTEKYLKFPLQLLHIFGLWRKEINPLIYFIYSLSLLFFTQYLYAICQMIYMVNVWGDIGKVAEASYLLLTQATLCFKILIFVWKKNKIIHLTKLMNGSTFAPSRSAHLPILTVSSSIQVAEFFIFLSMSSLTIALWAIFPQIDAAPEERVLPFKAWYPLPNDQTPYYELLYSYQITGIWFSALINVSIDRLSTSMTAFGCAQVQILKDNLINIEEYVTFDLEKNLRLKSTKNESSHTEGTMNFAVELNLYKGIYIRSGQLDIEELIQISLVKSILHHKHIVGFLYLMQECFHWGILAQISSSVGIICITGLQITLIQPTSFKFASQVLYLVAMMAQIFFICRIGTEITVISGELVEAAYKCPWIERKRKFNTTLLIFMERLKQPIVTRAGYFFPLSLQMFVSILRSSYSYFAVLQQLNSAK